MTELDRHAAAIVRDVRKGEVAVVSKHKRAVAMIVPLDDELELVLRDPTRAEGLAESAAARQGGLGSGSGGDGFAVRGRKTPQAWLKCGCVWSWPRCTRANTTIVARGRTRVVFSTTGGDPLPYPAPNRGASTTRPSRGRLLAELAGAFKVRAQRRHMSAPMHGRWYGKVYRRYRGIRARRRSRSASSFGRLLGVLDREHGLERGDRDRELLAVGLARGQVLEHQAGPHQRPDPALAAVLARPT